MIIFLHSVLCCYLRREDRNELCRYLDGDLALALRYIFVLEGDISGLRIIHLDKKACNCLGLLQPFGNCPSSSKLLDILFTFDF